MDQPFNSLISYALFKSVKNYTFSKLKSDLIAAIIVSVVSLPLAIALSISIGLPPEYGIYTAISAGMITPLLGGSIWQVTGPTAAFITILIPIVEKFGLRGIIWSSCMAGFFLIIFGLLNLGKLINYIPYSIIIGFTSGISIVLGVVSLNDFFSLNIKNFNGEFITKLILILKNIKNIDIPNFIIGFTTLFLLFTSHKITKKIPNAFFAIFTGITLGSILTAYKFKIITIGTKFSYISRSSTKLFGIPPYLPTIHIPSFAGKTLFTIPTINEFSLFFIPAFSISILIALESLLSATIADNMTKTKHSSRSELIGIGIGNIFSALTCGFAATGAIARTSINIKNGAKTVLASFFHAIFIIIYILFLTPYLNLIPMSSLAAILIYTAYDMSHYKQFIRILKIAPKYNIITLLLSFFLTISMDMIVGITVGVISALILKIKRMQKLTHNDIIYKKINTSNGIKEICLYKINGPVFFATLKEAFNISLIKLKLINYFILDISKINLLDITGLVELKDFLQEIAKNNIKIYILKGDKKILLNIKNKLKKYTFFKKISFKESLHEIFIKIEANNN